MKGSESVGGRHPATQAHAARAAVLFDLDGTLINTKRLYLECYSRAVEPLLGRPPAASDFSEIRPRSEIRFIHDLVGDGRAQQCMIDFYREYEQLHPSHFDGVYAGIASMLKMLRAAGIPLGIVTGKSRRSWEISRTQIELGHFDALVFDDDVPACKPDPSGIRLALQLLQANPANTIYAGDSITDLDAALAAGVQPAGVLWPKRGEDRARFVREATQRAARLFASPAELLDAVIGNAGRPEMEKP